MSRQVTRASAAAVPADLVDPPAPRGCRAPNRGRVRTTRLMSPHLPRHRKKIVEEEQIEDISDISDNIEIQLDPRTPLKTKGAKKDSLSLDAAERALKKQDLISPSVRQTSISPSAWPSAQGDLDFTNAN
jgi:hypothetical protein